jgi:hypothetical protein
MLLFSGDWIDVTVSPVGSIMRDPKNLKSTSRAPALFFS